MRHNSFPKGSEWKIWDFQVHTPESKLCSEFGDDWDGYVEGLFRKAIERGIAGIGITDYYSIDGYKKLRNDYIENEEKLSSIFDADEIDKIKKIFIFPNIEFRLNKLVVGGEYDLRWNRKVNCHLLLSDKVKIEHIEGNILNRLQFEDIGSMDSVVQKSPINRDSFERLGKRLKEEHANFRDKSDLFIGLINASINEEDLFEILIQQENLFGGNWIFGIPIDEDLSVISWDSQSHLQRKILIQKSKIIFSANPATIDFCLGKRHPNLEEYISEFKRLKPCISGSDAHSIEGLFEVSNNRYTWIKANPTFDGLKQVVYEPEERVKIQENIPEEKTPYLVIDSVRFIDNSNNNIFSDELIELNENLNTIIGGKSSGKSILLHHMASAIDNDQVDEKYHIAETNNYTEFRRNIPFDFEVHWKSGEIDKLSELKLNEVNQITYIPQGYINKLAEEKGEMHLFKLINDILRQNNNFNDFYSEIIVNIEEKQTEIFKDIEALVSLREDLIRIIKEANEIGKKPIITKEIERLKREVEKLRKESNFTEAENEKYEFLIAKRDFFEGKKLLYANIIDYLEELKSIVDKAKEDIDDAIYEIKDRSYDREAEEKIINKVADSIINKIEKGFLESGADLFILTGKRQRKIDYCNKKVEEIEKLITPYKTKIKNQAMLAKVSKELEIQNMKLNRLNKKINEYNSVYEQGKNINKEILEYYKDLFELYIQIENELGKEEYKRISDDLELESSLIFDKDKFSKFSSLFDLRTKLSLEFGAAFNDMNEFIFDKNKHVDIIGGIFEKFKERKAIEEMRTRKGIGIKDIYINLFDNCFDFKYRIIRDKEDILDMSPGKRGIVLLQLILHISNAMHPILIDQPEDNLDNRTIYGELKKFIRQKKCERQIVIVTHNANLVVSTDSENIIVANQSGEQEGKDNNEYRFEYISGALENSYIKAEESGILYKYGVREHVCDILEGGEEAFKERERKYGFR